jgi:hypothetical protein
MAFCDPARVLSLRVAAQPTNSPTPPPAHPSHPSSQLTDTSFPFASNIASSPQVHTVAFLTPTRLWRLAITSQLSDIAARSRLPLKPPAETPRPPHPPPVPLVPPLAAHGMFLARAVTTARQAPPSKAAPGTVSTYLTPKVCHHSFLGAFSSSPTPTLRGKKKKIRVPSSKSHQAVPFSSPRIPAPARPGADLAPASRGYVVRRRLNKPSPNLHMLRPNTRSMQNAAC